MTEHTKTDGLPSLEAPQVLERGRPRNERMASSKIECNACPVLCQISEGRAGACDRYANHAGVLIRLDPVVLLHRELNKNQPKLVQFEGRIDATDLPNTTPSDAKVDEGADWDGDLLLADQVFVTGVGSSTTYPDYKPAPFIVASKSKGVDMVTVVTEGIFSYCSLKVKIDTDRYLGDERAAVLFQGEEVGHVTTAEYGSQMLSLGGVHHLTGGSKAQGRMALQIMHSLGNHQAVEVQIENGAKLVLQAGQAPVVDGVTEQRMRVCCGSAAIGMFARQWLGV